MSNTPKICIDARIASPGLAGGIEQVVIGLAKGLSGLDDGDEQFYFLTYEDTNSWLAPYVKGRCRLLNCPGSLQRFWRRHIATKLPVVKNAIEKLSSMAGNRAIHIPRSDNTIERAGMDLMHFTLQSAFTTPVPSIYHPHDLQHIHLPNYFSSYERMGRTQIYMHHSRRAAMVAAASSWAREDFIRHLGIHGDKTHVVPLAPSTSAYANPGWENQTATRRKFSLPDLFAFYPAQTWPHKNHLGLIEATALLRDNSGITIPLVFSGRTGGFHNKIAERIQQLDLTDQVQFLGFVTPVELQSLYHLSRCVVIPTKFEAASFPVFEAFLAGKATACSNVTSLPKQVGDAALTFDPDDPADIASKLKQLWESETLRTKLAHKGTANVKRFTWDRTARHFRAHYRRILGVRLTDEDRLILNSDPLF
jgi:glycosyltransferase involved in cell wall biosynthesis